MIQKVAGLATIIFATSLLPAKQKLSKFTTHNKLPMPMIQYPLLNNPIQSNNSSISTHHLLRYPRLILSSPNLVTWQNKLTISPSPV